MEPEEKTYKQVIRNIGCLEYYKYLTLPFTKKQLNYPQQCIENPQNAFDFSELISIDCEMVQTTEGLQICSIIAISETHEVVYQKLFNVRKGTTITDYITHITGLKAKDFQKIPVDQVYDEKSVEEIQKIVKNKIVCGHDLSNDLALLKIKHNAFIDTLALYPHFLGLPFKNKLKDVAFNKLQRHIQWGAHNPKEDAQAVLDIIIRHCKQGCGTIQTQEFPQKDYNNNIQEILKDAELQKDKLLLFVLRGSRALGLTIDIEGYVSDWDYVAVYDTDSKMDAKLIKLPQIDISIFDKHSFRKDVYENNDISYMQIFFLPPQFVFINKFQFPKLQVRRLRQSLGFHLNKAKMKAKRFMKEIKENPSKQLKILKTIHMKMRFIDNFIQLKKEMDKKQLQIQIDVTRLRGLWQQIKEKYKQTNFQTSLKWVEKVQIQKMKECKKVYSFAKRIRYEDNTNIFKNRRVRNAGKQFQISKKYQYNQIQYSSSKLKINKVHLKLQIVRYLQQNDLETLQSFRINYKRHRKYPHIVQLHYQQSASFNHNIQKQCRGIILDESKNYEVVALPYYKFFDFNDPKFTQIKNIDIQSLRVYEKKDGSTATLYYYEGQWFVSSSSVPDGLNLYCFSKRQTTTEFGKQFWKIFHKSKFEMPTGEDRNKSFIFELMSKNHIIVVEREQSQLSLHGVRNIQTLEEEDHIPYGKKYNWHVSQPLQLQYKTIEDLVNIVEKMNPLKCEGLVVCDKYWRRMKIKNSEYVRINWLGELNLGGEKDPKKYILMTIILSGEGEVFSKYCPEWSKVIHQYMEKIQKLNENIEKIYKQNKSLEKKEFAQKIRQYPKDVQSLVFGLRGNWKKFEGRVEQILNPKKFYKFITNYQP